MTQEDLPGTPSAEELGNVEPESPDAARAWKGPVTAQHEGKPALALHREDLLAVQLHELRAIVEGQKLIIAKLQLDALRHQHAEELRQLQARQRQQIGAAEMEIAMFSEAAKGAEATTRAVWKDVSAVYKLDFTTLAFDDVTGVILRAGEPVPPNEMKESGHGGA